MVGSLGPLPAILPLRDEFPAVGAWYGLQRHIKIRGLGLVGMLDVTNRS